MFQILENIMRRYFIFFICFLSNAFSQSAIYTAQSFKDVQAIIQHHTQASNTLIVFDEDDTLLMMPCESKNHCQYIGGPAWFDWQKSLASNDPKKVAPTFQGLLSISNQIISNSHQVPTDRDEKDILNQLAANGYHMMVATARSPSLSQATHRALEENQFSEIFSNHAPIKTQSILSFKNKRPMIYSKGVYYLSGQNKGEAIKTLVASIPQHQKYSSIVLVDDTEKNIKEFADAFKNTPHITGIAIDYSKLKAHKARFLMSPKRQDVAAKNLARFLSSNQTFNHNH